MKEIKSWKCEFCESVFTSRIECALHELKCGNNYNKRNCYTCAYYIFKECLNTDRSSKPMHVAHPTHTCKYWEGMQ